MNHAIKVGDRQELKQTSPTYDWENFRPSAFCGCFRFTTQLVLVGCCGSFLFGFNVSVLNTAVNAVGSEFQLCGKPSGVVEHLYDLKRNDDSNGQRATDFMNLYPTELNGVCSVDENNKLTCNSGYTKIDCPAFKWYVALLQSAIMIFGTAGAVLAGRMINGGRRYVFLMTVLVFLTGVICTLCANSFSAMFWGRLIVGLGVGLVSVISPTYISEMTPRQERGKFGTFHQLTITVGIFIGILLGFGLEDPASQSAEWAPSTFQRFYWRFMLGLGLIPVLISLYLLKFVYTFETPVYYIENERFMDAEMVLRKILPASEVAKELEEIVRNVQEGKAAKRGGRTFMSAMADPEYRYVFLVGMALAAFQQFGGINVFMTSSNTIFANAGFKSELQTAMSTIMGLINVLMTFVTIYVIDRYGRRRLLFVGSLMQFIVLLPAAISYWTESDPANPTKTTGILAAIGVIGFVIAFAIAFGPVVWVYLFEIFPMDLKDAASSYCTAFNWLSAVIIVFVANVIPNQISFTLFAVLQCVATVFVYACIKETKGCPLGTSPFITSRDKQASHQLLEARA